MKTKVASIRTVDWGRMQLNFNIVFPKGVLEDAPQFNVLSTHAPDEKSSAKLQSESDSKISEYIYHRFQTDPGTDRESTQQDLMGHQFYGYFQHIYRNHSAHWCCSHQ